MIFPAVESVNNLYPGSDCESIETAACSRENESVIVASLLKGYDFDSDFVDFGRKSILQPASVSYK
jgi:hypothetical protein